MGWQGRYCGDTEKVDHSTGRTYKIPKAITTIQDNVAGKFVMFGDNLNTSDHCVLCEGPVDALKTELCHGNVAALGKGVSNAQIEWIADRVTTLYIALDPDAADEVIRIAREASNHGVRSKLMVPPKGKKDFGECDQLEAVQAFKDATPIGGNSIILNLGGSLSY